MTSEPAAPDLIDARGLRCPLPIIRLAAVARDLAPGTGVTVLTTDPAARPDVAAWCRMRGHDLISQELEPDDGSGVPVLRHVIRLRLSR